METNTVKLDSIIFLTPSSSLNNIDILPKKSVQVHIHIKQRTAKTFLTLLYLPPEIETDRKKLTSFLKRKLQTGGAYVRVDDGDNGNNKGNNDNKSDLMPLTSTLDYIQLQGDKRQQISDILLELGLCEEEQIKIHGF
jgi:translation initiation factor 1 (eIF-1/SUI1)